MSDCKPSLVLLHGWGMNAGVWQPLLPELESHFQVVLVELPGHGDSAEISGGLDAWANACLQAAPKDAIWLAWSLGAQIAIQAALRNPQAIKGLFLVGATPRFVQAEDWSNAMPQKVFEQFACVLAEDPQGTLNRFLALQVKGAEDAKSTLRQLREATQSRPQATQTGLAQGLELLLNNDLRDALTSIACPHFWLHGEKDTLSPAAVSADIKQLTTKAQTAIIERAGHAPFLSHTQQCMSLLHTFVEECYA